MIAEISAGLSSLKATSDILKGLNAALTETKLNEVKLDLQRSMLDATQALMAAQASEATNASRIRDLEQEIVRLKDWSTEKQRYQLHDVGRGAFTYVPKLGMEYGEPPHWLCVRCFGQGQKSFMQNKGNGVGNRTISDRGLDKTFACDTCKANISVSWGTDPQADRERMVIAAQAAASN